MDESRPLYSLKAPGSSGSPLGMPGRGGFPRVDDHLVEPEVTRDEVIGGRRVVASPSNPPHATQHFTLDYVLQAHLAPGYRGATDLITRHDVESDFASDACVLKEGVDPATGARYLEEIAFEVVSEQNQGLVNEKALRMHRRGVRRIFTVWVKGQRRVCEWAPESQSWRLLETASRIEDSCFTTPLAVAALLDAVEADNAVAEALLAKGNPTLRAWEAATEARATAQAILKVLEARGFSLDEAQRQEILECRDPGRLDHWLYQASVASSVDEVLAVP